VENWLNRRRFLGAVGGGAALALWPAGSVTTRTVAGEWAATMPPEWIDPPHEFSQIPFWFWNDDLSEAELLRQIEDFQAHGVHGFLIHPRAGLPKSIAWLNERMIGFMRFAIERAAERDMKVILYDEGMYPSGSSRSPPIGLAGSSASISTRPSPRPRFRASGSAAMASRSRRWGRTLSPSFDGRTAIASRWLIGRPGKGDR